MVLDSSSVDLRALVQFNLYQLAGLSGAKYLSNTRWAGSSGTDRVKDKFVWFPKKRTSSFGTKKFQVDFRMSII